MVNGLEFRGLIAASAIALVLASATPARAQLMMAPLKMPMIVVPPPSDQRAVTPKKQQPAPPPDPAPIAQPSPDASPAHGLDCPRQAKSEVCG